MRKAFTFLASLLLCLTVSAQIPQGISHQAVVRDAQGKLVTNSNIGIRVSIIQGSANGIAVYVETHSAQSNLNGLITYIIGEGASQGDLFEEINWADGPYFLKTEIDPYGGADYSISGATQLLSVPYSLHSQTAESLTAGGNFALPVMTTLEILEMSPRLGQTVFNTIDNTVIVFNGNQWVSFSSACWPQPTLANAGADQYLSDGRTSTILSANTPKAGHGAGEWSVVSGAGGSFDNKANPNATFYGELDISYQLQWTISSECGESSDLVRVGLSEMVTDLDGNEYGTVLIGSTVWMTENLRVTKYSDGTPIPTGLSGSEWTSTNDGAYSINLYENIEDIGSDEEMLAAYGALYNWYAVSDSRGLCPVGWRVPSDDDWDELFFYIIEDDRFFFNRSTDNNVGQALKSCRQQNSPLGDGCDTNTHPRWDSHETVFGTNDINFSGLPAGSRGGDNEGIFYEVGQRGSWWSSTAQDDRYASVRILSFDSNQVSFGSGGLRNGTPVRCVKSVN